MCGIAGLINFKNVPAKRNIIQLMTNSIRHRGPDGEGIWLEDNVAFGHRRLSILDLSKAGNQPMITQDNRWIISFNGEIYNYKIIRSELESLGVIFRTKTDTEVLLYAFVQWGFESLLKFNGMFAFAIWDRLEKKLILARDRYGIKPLYYSLQESFF